MSAGITHIVAALVKAAATPEMILAAVAADAQHTAACYAEEARRVEALNEARRAASREKKRAQRLASSLIVPRTNGDNAGQSGTDGDTVSPKNPPLEITPLKITPSDGSQDARVNEAACRMEFTMEFWPLVENKVSRPEALRAYIAARAKASKAEILVGLDRYQRTKPPDREWMNPANWLQNERWTDEPASTANQTRDKPHDTIFGALAGIVEEGRGIGEREAGPDGGGEGFAGPEGADRFRGRSLEIPAFMRRTA